METPTRPTIAPDDMASTPAPLSPLLPLVSVGSGSPPPPLEASPLPVELPLPPSATTIGWRLWPDELQASSYSAAREGCKEELWLQY